MTSIGLSGHSTRIVSSLRPFGLHAHEIEIEAIRGDRELLGPVLRRKYSLELDVGRPDLDCRR